VHVYDQGSLPEARNQFFIDMELCSFNLRTYIYEPAKCVLDTTLPPGYRVQSVPSRTIPATVWDIMKQISSGVAFMHNHNHVHRDIKPENSNTRTLCFRLTDLVLFSPQKSLWKITDFGFVAQVSSKLRNRPSTYVRGTEGYRAPELRTGNHVYSTKTDIWALGCVLHELAFGEPAFQGDWAASDYGRSNTKLEFPMKDLCWHDSDKIALGIMLERALAVKEYFRPSADLMVNLIESIIQDIGVSPDDGLLELPTTPHTPAVSEVGPIASETTSDDERPETEPESQSDGRPDEEDGSISSSPSRQRTTRCRQCNKSFPVQKDIIKHDKTWLGQIRENSCSDCQPLFQTNDVISSESVSLTTAGRCTSAPGSRR
jgi:serine/threonine protein kinase